MRTIPTSNISDDEIERLRRFAREHAGPELRLLLTEIAGLLDNGSEKISVVGAYEELTPNQVAGRLNMSRTHVYKLLDRGEIVWHAVGRDRRVRVRDLLAFEAQCENDRRELADRFANQQPTRSDALDEIAERL